MHSTTLGTALLSSLVAHVAGTPTKASELEKKNPQLSLPPLIPSIPGVTEPLVSILPPLPIIQPPTPPLDSPPFEVEDIKPKKIGYFWTGAGDNKHKDFLATVSLDDDTFGKFIAITDVPSSGNSPHHLGPNVDGTLLVGGGLLSLLKLQDTAFYFDTSDPYNPKFSHSNRALLSSITDEIRAKPEGGFFITYSEYNPTAKLYVANSKQWVVPRVPHLDVSLRPMPKVISFTSGPRMLRGLSISWANSSVPMV